MMYINFSNIAIVLFLVLGKIKLYIYWKIPILLKKVGYYKYQEQFWCYKYTRSSDLIKKKKKNLNEKENYTLKANVYMEMEKKTIKKFGDIEIEKQIFHQLFPLFLKQVKTIILKCF